MRPTYLLVIFFSNFVNLYAQNASHYLDQTYDPQKIREIIGYLASDDLGGRDTPSKGLELAAQYIGLHFKENGIQPAPGIGDYYQPVGIFRRKQPDSLVVQIGEKIIPESGNAIYVSGTSGMTRAVCQWLDSAAFSKGQTDFRNKVVLYFIANEPEKNPRKMLEQSMKMKAFVQTHGAAGMIEIFEEGHPLWERFIGYYSRRSMELVMADKEFLHITMQDENGSLRSGRDEISGADIQISLTGNLGNEVSSDNVIGVIEGSDPELKDEYILCTAHYDHVGIGRPDAEGDSIYNGARDNAIGVMSVMMAAEYLARSPARRSVILVLFTGEEKGLLGSQYFAKHPPVALKDILFCLNSDGGGYNDTTMATIIGMRRLDTYGVFERACESNDLNAFEGTDNTQFLFYNSDNAVFSREGIPSVTFSPGFREMDAEILKYYHQPSDEIESLDFTYLVKFARAYGMALKNIADSGERLFWKPGDEFYDQAMDLYEK